MYGISPSIRFWMLGILLIPRFLEASDNEGDFFESRIRPVLIEHCYECHSTSGKSIRGGLRVDYRDGLLEGGDSGEAIIPGKPDESLLIAAIRHEAYEMPPSGKLPEEVINDFVRWIEDGAFDPRIEQPKPALQHAPDDLPKDPREHWAFMPITPHPTPNTHDTDWCENDIDVWILAGLEAKGWQPSKPADRYTLLRRLTYSLIGLPPTREQIENFISDTRPDAYERVVDSLLASPAYGERWGRHWLDCVRYADTNGADENHGLPNAWRYRDWTIRAFNQDLPYDKMILHQLAGDLLPVPEDEFIAGELLAATGLLVIGPKMLAEQDKEKMIADIVDEQIDTVTKTFLGLTVSCARCHDHKFDPMPTEDYYALAGIFTSTQTMADRAFVSNWMERPLPSKAIEQARKVHAQQLAAKKEARSSWVQATNAELMAAGKFEQVPDKPEEHYSEDQKKQLAELTKAIEDFGKNEPQFDKAMAVTEATPVDVPVHIRGNHLNTAETKTPRGAPSCLQLDVPMPKISAQFSGRRELATWLANPRHPLTARVIVNRIWAWHFGEGLVRSPSNFGYRGEKPTHPELLDNLAYGLIDNDWSLKWLHREILTSNTFRMTSDSKAYTNEDPDNFSLWKRSPKRLEIEPLRDAILSIGHSLDHSLFGAPGVMDSNRRTVYVNVNRAALNDLFSTFDYVDPASHIEQRPVTTVPNQALFLLNHPLVHQQSRNVIEQIFARTSDRDAQLREIWLALYGRPPLAKEIQLAQEFLELAKQQLSTASNGDSDETEAWSSLVRTLVAGNEFIWIP